jgi:hypothetical protein
MEYLWRGGFLLDPSPRVLVQLRKAGRLRQDAPIGYCVWLAKMVGYCVGGINLSLTEIPEFLEKI